MRLAAAQEESWYPASITATGKNILKASDALELHAIQTIRNSTAG